MKKILLIALSVCYASLACAQTLPLQDTTISVTGTPKITSADGQSIRVVNTKGTASLAKAFAGDSCSTTGLLTEGAADALLTCAEGKWRNPRNLDQAAIQMTIVYFGERDRRFRERDRFGEVGRCAVSIVEFLPSFGRVLVQIRWTSEAAFLEIRL